MTIKPLADVVGDYTRSDGHKEIAEIFHAQHLLSVARLEKGSRNSIAQFGRVRQGKRGRPDAGQPLFLRIGLESWHAGAHLLTPRLIPHGTKNFSSIDIELNISAFAHDF